MFGPSGPTAHRRFTEWSAARVWAKLHRLILDGLGSRGDVNWSRCAIDSVNMWALKGAKPNLILVIWVVPLVVTALKGKYGMAVVGVAVHLCWWFGAIRRAKPDSYWARRFYDDDKLREAIRRFE